MNYILTLLPILLFTGCIGIGVVHEHTADDKDLHGKTVVEIEELFKYKKLLNKYSQNGKLIYEYNKEGGAYRGIVPMIGIGIPLILPVGSNEYELEFEDGICVKALEDYTDWSGYMCGLLNENGKMGCAPLGR